MRQSSMHEFQQINEAYAEMRPTKRLSENDGSAMSQELQEGVAGKFISRLGRNMLKYGKKTAGNAGRFITGMPNNKLAKKKMMELLKRGALLGGLGLGGYGAYKLGKNIVGNDDDEGMDDESSIAAIQNEIQKKYEQYEQQIKILNDYIVQQNKRIEQLTKENAELKKGVDDVEKHYKEYMDNFNKKGDDAKTPTTTATPPTAPTTVPSTATPSTTSTNPSIGDKIGSGIGSVVGGIGNGLGNVVGGVANGIGSVLGGIGNAIGLNEAGVNF